MGVPGFSTNPRSTVPSRTAAMACSLLVAVSTTSGTTLPRRLASPCSDSSQCGISCSAIVWLAATLIRSRPSFLSEPSPASISPATSSNRDPHSATMRPAGVSSEPRVVRTTNVIPICASMEASRLDTACCVIPSSRAARPRLPCSAIVKKTSKEASSGIRALSGTLVNTYFACELLRSQSRCEMRAESINRYALRAAPPHRYVGCCGNAESPGP